MSSLKSAMDQDASRVFANPDEFAEGVTYYPSAGAVGFSVDLVPADPAEQFVAMGTGVADERVMQAFGSLGDLTAGIAEIEDSRPPRRGDRVVFGAGAYAGSWVVQVITPDLGDGVTLTLRWSAQQLAGDKMAEVR